MSRKNNCNAGELSLLLWKIVGVIVITVGLASVLIYSGYVTGYVAGKNRGLYEAKEVALKNYTDSNGTSTSCYSDIRNLWLDNK